jgi:hypothetical protein
MEYPLLPFKLNSACGRTPLTMAADECKLALEAATAKKTKKALAKDTTTVKRYLCLIGSNSSLVQIKHHRF